MGSPICVCHALIMSTWGHYIAFLRFYFLSCKMGMTIRPTFQSWYEIEREIKGVRYMIELNIWKIFFMIIPPIIEKHSSIKIL